MKTIWTLHYWNTHRHRLHIAIYCVHELSRPRPSWMPKYTGLCTMHNEKMWLIHLFWPFDYCAICGKRENTIQCTEAFSHQQLYSLSYPSHSPPPPIFEILLSTLSHIFSKLRQQKFLTCPPPKQLWKIKNWKISRSWILCPIDHLFSDFSTLNRKSKTYFFQGFQRIKIQVCPMKLSHS